MALETTDQPKNRVWTSIVRWVDNYAAKPEISEGAEQAVDWVRIVPFVFLHLINTPTKRRMSTLRCSTVFCGATWAG